MADKGYNVAMAYKPHVVGYAGVRTWTCYPNKAEFDKWNAEQKDYDILGAGITSEQAVELTKGTPDRSYLYAAVHDAIDPDTGRVDFDKLTFTMEKAAFAIRHPHS